MKLKSTKIIVALTAASLFAGSSMIASLPASAANTSLLNYTPSSLALAASATKIKVSKPDQPIIDSAIQALRNLTGNTYSIGNTSLVKINGEQIWDLSVKGVDYSQILMKGTEVQGIKIEQPWDELKESYKQQVQKVMMNTLGSQITPTSVDVSITYDKRQDHIGKTQLYIRSNGHILIIHDGELTRHTQILTNASMDSAVLKTAQDVFKGWEGVKQGELQRSLSWLTREGDKEVYKLAFGSGNSPAFIDIDKATGTILKVQAGELEESQEAYLQSLDKLNSTSEAQLLKQAIKQAPALLQLDLNGYTTKKDPKMTGIVHFTKPGAPKITGQYNANGQFYMMERAQ
ncbi:hypothetical protein [Paenibacillus sp. FSL K6-1230]|uniref:hypothetical protein n=1 Tax=Paenibacillus sp. FSL K6-1230 TaxID=2921603 RepID=UPI0030F59FC1